MGFQRVLPWSPKRILAQMLVLQLIFYIGNFAALAGASIAWQQEPRFWLPWQPSSWSGVTTTMNLVALSLACFPTALAVVWIVQRSRLCADFSATIYIVHLAIVWLTDELPDLWEWWVCVVTSTVVMTALSEFLCMRRELESVEFASSSRARAARHASARAGPSDEDPEAQLDKRLRPAESSHYVNGRDDSELRPLL